MTIGSFDCWPSKVVSGPGALQSLGEIIKGMNKNRVIIITDKVMKEFPLITNLVIKLESEGFTVSLFGEIGPNPVGDMVHKAVDFMKETMPDVMVCIGGGSPIDAGKAANVVYTHGGTVYEYDIAIGGILKITDKLLPMIVIPTTAGSGTEVTYVGVITDTIKKTKFGVLSPLMIPDVSILDPEVTATMPPKLTAFTGIDALTHCIEAYTSCVGFPPADALAIHGIKMISRSLRTAVNDGQNLKAREEMLVASMMGGTAFSHNGLGACHAMAHQVSAFYDTPHGLANAILLPYIMRFNLSTNLQKFADIAEAMGADIRDLSVQQAAEKALELVEQLTEELGVPKYLDEVGATKTDIPAMVERAMNDNPLRTNPRSATVTDVMMLYNQAFSLQL